MKKGAANEKLYPPNREIGCAVCSSPLISYKQPVGTPGFCKAKPAIDRTAAWSLTGGVNVGPRKVESVEYEYWTLRARNACAQSCTTCTTVGVTTKAGYACFEGDRCLSDGALDRMTFPVPMAALALGAEASTLASSPASTELVADGKGVSTRSEHATELDSSAPLASELGSGDSLGSVDPSCSADCKAVDHVTYLPREAPVKDQWGSSQFVSSTKPVTPLPKTRFHFFLERLPHTAAATSCAKKGMSLAKLTSQDKVTSFKSQLTATKMDWDAARTRTRFEVLYDATYKGLVYDQTRSVATQGDSKLFWVHSVSQGDRGAATTCGSALAATAREEASKHLSREHIVDLAGNLLRLNTKYERDLMPTACKTPSGADVEFDYTELLGDFPPYERSHRFMRSDDATNATEELDAFCYLCHKDEVKNPALCATFGATEGLFAAGATDAPDQFNCDQLALPYACEETFFDTNATSITEETCTSATDLEVFPSNFEGSRFPTFVKQVTFYTGRLPVVGKHPKAEKGGVARTYITGMDVIMVEPENVPKEKKLYKYFTQSPLGSMVQADGSASISKTCVLEYGDTISGMVEMQSATATWGVGYLKWTSSRGVTCEVGTPASDPTYIIGPQHGGVVRNRDAYQKSYPSLVYGDCHEGYAKVQTREACRAAYKDLFDAMQVTGQNNVAEHRASTAAGLRGCFVDAHGNGYWQEKETNCDKGACDLMHTVCSLADPKMSSEHGRRSMSYIDADGRMLTRIGWYNVLKAVPLEPSLEKPFYEPLVARFGGLAPIFMKKIVESKFEIPSQVKWVGPKPVPRPQSVASHTYCNEDDVPRTFGAYSRSVTQEKGNEFCYSSWTSRTFSLSVEVDFSLCAAACFEAGGGMDYESTAARTETNCKSTTETSTEAMEFPTITLPARSAVQYSFTRRETTFQDAKITATELIIFSDRTMESLGTSEIIIQGVARTGTLATFSEVITLGDGVPNTCGYGQAALGAVRAPPRAPPPSPSSKPVLPMIPTSPLPKDYENVAFGCAHSALKRSRLYASPHDWGVEQLTLDTRGQARGFSVADQFFGGSAGCPSLVGAVPFVASQAPRSVVTQLIFTSAKVSTAQGDQEIVAGMVVKFQGGRREYFGQTNHDGEEAITTTTCSIPMNSLLTGLMHIGTHGRGKSARLGYLQFHVKLPGKGVRKCEPVKRSKALKVRSFYVERRIISGVIASGLNPLAHVGGFTEFAFTFWKRVTQVRILGAGGADKLDMNKLGEPDVPSPANEYYHNYCNSDDGDMEFGSARYDTSLADGSSMCTEDTEESSVGGFGYVGGGFSAEINVCGGFGAMQCTTALEMEFNVRLTVGSSTTSGSSSTSCTTTTKTSETSLEMPGITLGGHESTEYKVTLFRKKLADVTIQLIKQLQFEDGTTALMPPQDFKMRGVMTTASMASFQRQVKGLDKGCSYILEPAVPGVPGKPRNASLH